VSTICCARHFIAKDADAQNNYFCAILNKMHTVIIFLAMLIFRS
jgi:hypothetical protein